VGEGAAVLTLPQTLPRTRIRALLTLTLTPILPLPLTLTLTLTRYADKNKDKTIQDGDEKDVDDVSKFDDGSWHAPDEQEEAKEAAPEWESPKAWEAPTGQESPKAWEAPEDPTRTLTEP